AWSLQPDAGNSSTSAYSSPFILPAVVMFSPMSTSTALTPRASSSASGLISPEQPADARSRDAIDRVETRRTEHDQDHAERGRLAVGSGDILGKDSEGDHLPAAQREEQRGGRLLDRHDEGKNRADEDALPHERRRDVPEGDDLAG